MLDDALDYIEHIRRRPVWQPLPTEVRARLQERAPHQPSDLAEVHGSFLNDIMPFATGNTHPGFMGWVHGGGTPVGLLAEMLAASLNANLGGRDHAPIEVEQQIVRWMREIFGFPESATGLFVTGTSMANFIAVLIARDVALGFETRREGVTGSTHRLTAYASSGVHSCVARAMDFCGIGSDALRLIPTGLGRGIDVLELEKAIEVDRQAGFTPFLLVGTAGSVDTGAIDDLGTLADLSQREKLWFHIDGACGALAMLAPELAPKLSGIERADSVAFDFHKWGQVPYDAGFILVRDGEAHNNAFATSAGYLRREESGLAGGSFWPCDFGPDLSRGFRALKTWFTLKVYGIDALGATIARTCRLARYLESRIQETPDLELLAPVELNIVCFRYRVRDCDADRLNAKIVADLQNDGRTAPSTAIIDGHLAIRAAIVNHRTSEEEIDTLVESVLASGRAIEHAVHSKFWRASLLADTGRTDEAKQAFLDLLSQEPSHRGALNEFGLLLQQTGYRTAACTAFRQAVIKHPDDHASRILLAHALRENGDAAGAREHYEAALRMTPDDIEAHQGLACVLADLGDREAAKRHRKLGFGGRPVTALPYRGQGEPVSLLVLSGTAGGNVPIRYLFDEKVFRTSIVFVEHYDTTVALPHHQLVFNAIGDADSEGAALIAAKYVLAHTTAPIVNRLGAVAATGRSDNASRLSGIAGAVTPRATTLPRQLLSGPNAAAALARYRFEFPLLIRTPGFHTGRYFVRVETPADLPAALAELPGEELTVIQYLDARGADGKVRKYRAMSIDGQLYPLHAAISNHWKIHYFTAEMAESPQHRAEDAEFLRDMPGILGPRAMAALTEIQSRLGLDYAGIDFGLNTKGEVLIFEANATMVVNPPEQGEKWAYRRPAVERIHTAVRNMLIERSGIAVHKGWNSGEFRPMSSAWPVSSGTPNPSLRSQSPQRLSTTMPRWW